MSERIRFAVAGSGWHALFYVRAAKRLPAGFAGKSYCDANHAASSFADKKPKNDWRSIIRADKFCQGGWISTSFFPYT